MKGIDGAEGTQGKVDRVVNKWGENKQEKKIGKEIE